MKLDETKLVVDYMPERLSQELPVNSYRFYWLTGNVDHGTGRNPAEALTKLGYSQGAVRALDFYTEGEVGPSEYAWVNGGWERLPC